MTEEQRTMLRGIIQFSTRMSKTLRHGVNLALKDQPNQNFAALEMVHYATRQHGTADGLTVSQLAKCANQPLPAVSRTLRQLEERGLIERQVDPADRRRVFVRLSEQGEHDRKQCEDAVADYLYASFGRLGTDRIALLDTLCHEVEAAFAAEAAKHDPQNTTKEDPSC